MRESLRLLHVLTADSAAPDDLRVFLPGRGIPDQPDADLLPLGGENMRLELHLPLRRDRHRSDPGPAPPGVLRLPLLILELLDLEQWGDGALWDLRVERVGRV